MGPNPRLANGIAPTSCHLPLYGLVLTTPLFEKMSRRASESRVKLPAVGNLSREMPKKGFETVDLLSAFVKPGGSAMDLTHRLSPEFDLKEELLSGRVKVLTKTDRLVPRDKKSKRKYCFYNWFSKQMIWNYENWVSAQRVEDWCLVSYKCLYDSLHSLMGMSLVSENWHDPLSMETRLSMVLRGFGNV